MAEPESKRQPPRFPFVAALLCGACVGAAAWTWMRYSWLWEVTSEHLARAAAGGDPWLTEGELPWYVGRYIALHGVLVEDLWGESLFEGGRYVIGGSLRSGETVVRATCRLRYDSYLRHRDGGPRDLVGRLSFNARTGRAFLDAASPGRFHGASVAGLVVGAMGVFVFSVALRHWLGERRAATALEAS